VDIEGQARNIGRKRSAESLSLLLKVVLCCLQLVMERQQGVTAASQALLEGCRYLIPDLEENVLELAPDLSTRFFQSFQELFLEIVLGFLPPGFSVGKNPIKNGRDEANNCHSQTDWPTHKTEGHHSNCQRPAQNFEAKSHIASKSFFDFKIEAELNAMLKTDGSSLELQTSEDILLKLIQPACQLGF